MKHILVFYIPEDHHLVYIIEGQTRMEQLSKRIMVTLHIKTYRSQKLTIMANNIPLLVYKLDHLVLIFLEGERWSGLID